MQSSSGRLDGPSKLRLIRYVLKHYVYSKIQSLGRVIKGSGLDLIGWLSGHVELSAFRRLEGRLERLLGFQFRRWHVVALGILLYKALRLLERIIRYIAAAPDRTKLREQMAAATTYEEWLEPALQLDKMLGNDVLDIPKSRLRALHDKATHLKHMRETENIHGLMWALREDTHRSVGTLMRQACASHQKTLSPMVPIEVDSYLQEVKTALSYICTSELLDINERITFMRELRHSYGRTALVFSGGGSYGHFHFGIIAEMERSGLLPRVTSGSSAGSLGCAILGTRTDEELRAMIGDWINNPNIDFYGAAKTGTTIIKNFLSKGTIHDAAEYIQRLQRLLGNMTFEQAYVRTGKILNIAVTPFDSKEPPRLLNYLTAPHAVIWSAVAASSAFPGLFAPQELYAIDASGRVVPYSQHGAMAQLSSTGQDRGGGPLQRRFADGSLTEDLPMLGLGHQFNVNHFIVSQCNPYLVPLLSLLRMLPWKLQLLVEWEMKHRMSQMLQFWPHNKLLKLLTQPWEGDINFVLPATLFAPHKSAVNFNKADIVTAMMAGQRAVWSKLAVLHSSCAIEVAIDAELKRLTLQAQSLRKQRQRVRSSAASTAMLNNNNNNTGGRRGLPSWLHLQALGLPPGSESNEDLILLAGGGDHLTNRGASLDSISELPGAADAGGVTTSFDDEVDVDGAGTSRGALVEEEMLPLSPKMAGMDTATSMAAWNDINALMGLDAAAY